MSVQLNTSRWESSRKSLFVKTVWTEGHRHVVLFESDPLAEYFKLSSKRSSRATSSVSKNSSTSSIKSSTSSSCDFHVSSVKLLLAGIRNLKKEPAKGRHYLSKTLTSNNKRIETLSIDVIPNDRVKFKNINDDVSITINGNGNQRNNTANLLKAVKISLVPNIDDMDYRQECVDNNEYLHDHYETPNLLTPHRHSVDATFSDRYNTLSDRVLMWLDLATQNNESSEKNREIEHFKNVDFEVPMVRNRIVTAHNCSNLRRQQSFNYRKMLNRSRSYDYHESKPHADEWSRKQDFLYLKTTEIPNYTTLKISNIEDNSITCQNTFATGPIPPKLSSRQEDNRLTVSFAPETRTTVRQRTEILKRQLHIFVPNVPKKYDDCDSSLSSKSKTSLLSKRSSL